MEINQIYNSELKEALVNTAIGVLVDNQLIEDEDFKGLGAEFGYIFSTEEGQIEALFKIYFSEKNYILLLKKVNL